MKKVTIITRQTKKFGGIERFVATLAKMLRDDYAVEIVANYGRPTERPAFVMPEGVSIKYLSAEEPKAVSLRHTVSSRKLVRIPAELRRRCRIKKEQQEVFQKYLRELKTDYIITERAEYSSLVGKFYTGAAKKIATDHNFHQNNKKYIARLLKSVHGFNYLVVATRELQNFYQSQTKIKVVCILNALDKISKKKAKLETKQLLAVGRLEPEKDFSTLIDVMGLVREKMPDVRLVLIGDGTEKQYLEEKIREKGLEDSVQLPGYLTQKEMEPYFLGSSLYIMTSKTEAFGLVLAEAMSYGLPCVAFNRASGARAQISERTGILVPGDDATKMAEEIVALLNDQKRLKNLQKNIESEIAKYSYETVKQEWLKIL